MGWRGPGSAGSGPGTPAGAAVAGACAGPRSRSRARHVVGSVKMTSLLGLEAGVRAWLCLPTSALEKSGSACSRAQSGTRGAWGLSQYRGVRAPRCLCPPPCCFWLVADTEHPIVALHVPGPEGLLLPQQWGEPPPSLVSSSPAVTGRCGNCPSRPGWPPTLGSFLLQRWVFSRSQGHGHSLVLPGGLSVLGLTPPALVPTRHPSAGPGPPSSSGLLVLGWGYL